MKDSVENALRASLERIQTAINQYEQAKKFTRDLAQLKALQELIREQIANENSHTSTSQTR